MGKRKGAKSSKQPLEGQSGGGDGPSGPSTHPSSAAQSSDQGSGTSTTPPRKQTKGSHETGHLKQGKEQTKARRKGDPKQLQPPQQQAEARALGPPGQMAPPQTATSTPQQQPGVRGLRPPVQMPPPQTATSTPHQQPGVRGLRPPVQMPPPQTATSTPQQQPGVRGLRPFVQMPPPQTATSTPQQQAGARAWGPPVQMAPPQTATSTPQQQPGVRGLRPPVQMPPPQAAAAPKQQQVGDKTKDESKQSTSQQPKQEGVKSRSPAKELAVCPRIYSAQKSGKPIQVYANFYRLILKNPQIIVYHYDVGIEPEKPKFLMRPAWNAFASMMFPHRITVFDGMRNAFSKGPLLQEDSCSARVTIQSPEDGRIKEFQVTIQKVRIVDFSIFGNYRQIMQRDTKLKTLPEAEITVLEIILKNWAANAFLNSNRHFFPRKADGARSVELSRKLELRHGFFQSAFLGYVPYVNFDISHKAFYREVSLLEVFDSFTYRQTGQLNEQEANSFLRTAKVVYKVPTESTPRIFRVNKLVSNARRQSFKKDDGSTVSVADYFAYEKRCPLKYPNLPLLWVGPTQRSIFIPAEFCTLAADQVYKGPMDGRETSQMVRSATSNARDRRRNVMDVFSKIHFNNPYMNEFGLSVSGEMERVNARVLDAPGLKTQGPITVRDGVWNSRDFLEPKILRKWCILNLDYRASREGLMNFEHMIKSKGRQLNMDIGNPMTGLIQAEPTRASLAATFSKLKDMDIVFVIIPDAKGVYARVKTICEMQEGVLTQCIKSKTVSQDSRNLPSTVENILLKVNAKLGGKNHCLDDRSMPQCLKGCVMIVGADVTHPSPGSKIPSVAAVAVSCDSSAFKYQISMRVQKGEMIQDFEEMMKSHLYEFRKIRNKFPERIILFRDGVSEGELDKVLSQELNALKRACGNQCEPKITVVVVQKRHHTRLYPTTQRDEQGRNFNVPVGTCVDSDIVHPRDLDFYLVSHFSILGTARPSRYRVLYDDNKLTDEEVEKLTYYLCHLYSRCKRSVSYPSPTYYAHLAAFRARAYLEGLDLKAADDLKSIQAKMTDKISCKSPMFFV